MPHYPIEIINVGKPDFKLHEEIIKAFNSLQDDFKYFLPPDRLKSWASPFVRLEYSTDYVFERLDAYRAETKGFHPFIIGIVHSRLDSSNLGNLFGSFSPAKKVAVITTHDWENHFAPPPLAAYLAYSFVNHTMRFIAPEIKNHEETRNCYFDKAIHKPDIKFAMSSGGICDSCRNIFERHIDGSTYISLVKVVDYVKELCSDKIQIHKTKPKVFIGSSVEGLQIAEIIQLGLDHVAECTLWSQGVFGLSQGNLENLVKAATIFDYAILVLTPDDVQIRRNVQTNTPRDNVLFELGLFMGALGREKTFVVYNRDERLELLSDLAGVSAATFGNRQDRNLEAAIGPVCTQLKKAMNLI